MRFSGELDRRNLKGLLEAEPFKFVELYGMDKATDKLLKCMQNNGLIYIRPDCDCDGALGALAMKKILDQIGYENYHVGEIKKKNHGITYEEVMYLVKNNYDLAIIIDSSTNSLDLLRALSANQIDTIILDHHDMDYSYEDYPESCVLINPTGSDLDYKDISGCFVTSLFGHKILNKLGKLDNKIEGELFNLGYITLLSDCCDLSNEYNLSIAKNTDRYRNYIPVEIQNFMSQWDMLNRNFVDYKLAPRINAQFRMERLDILYHYLYLGEFEYMMELETTYKQAKSVTNYLSSSIEYKEYENIVLANMDTLSSEVKSICGSVMRNFTGLVSNSAMKLYNKPVLTIMDMGEGFYEGSIREPYNRNILKYFKIVAKAGGHPSAFGVSFRTDNLDNVIQFIDEVLKNNNYSLLDTIYLDGDNTDADVLVLDSRAMAEYNEISGGLIPKACIKKQLTYDMEISEQSNYTKIMWGDIRLVAFTKVYYGAVVEITPCIQLNGVSYHVTNILTNL